MAVDQDGRLARRAEPLGVDDGVPLGRDQLGLEPHRRQVVPDEFRRPASVGVVIGLGADAGNPDQVLELLFKGGPMLLEDRRPLDPAPFATTFPRPDDLPVPACATRARLRSCLAV